MNEFEIIRRYFTRKPGRPEDIRLGIGDDAAVVATPEGYELVLAMDSLVKGVHFPDDTVPEDIGWKALAVNLSDLAAMGAEPRWATLSLTLPEADEGWLEAFSRGFFELAERYRVDLIGGDLTHGPLSVTVQAHGLVPGGQAVMRCGARSGDGIFVTGTLGDAGHALSGAVAATHNQDHFSRRLNRPEPRVDIGMAIRGIATAAIDISDGLVADLRHILEASHVGAEIKADRIPLSAPLRQALAERDALRIALSAGDDYELCITAPMHKAEKLHAICNAHHVPIHCIGSIFPSSGLHITGFDMTSLHDSNGYRHFN